MKPDETLLILEKSLETLQQAIEVAQQSLLAIKESDKRTDRFSEAVEHLANCTGHQSETFIMQIQKLSSRIDAAEQDRHKLIEFQADQGKRIDTLTSLLHDSITKQQNFIQQQ